MFAFSRSPRNQDPNHGRKAGKKFSVFPKKDQPVPVTVSEDHSSVSQPQSFAEEPACKPWPESWEEVLRTSQAGPVYPGHGLGGRQLSVTTSGYPSLPLSPCMVLR